MPLLAGGDDPEARCAAELLGDAWRDSRVAVLLGSGLGTHLPSLENRREAAYADLPGLGACAVPGHQGRLVGGRLAGIGCLLFCGRRHLYEGLAMAAAAFPARLAAHLGARVLITFSAVGAVDPELPVGSWVLVEDHLNLMGRNPLEGVHDERGPAFVDLTHTYRVDLWPDLARRLTPLLGAGGLERGVLAAFPGPTYETPAEVRMARTLGARVVGMSTVPEAVWARFLGLDVLALAQVVNPAAGVSGEALCHTDVVRRAEAAASQVPQLISAAVAAWKHAAPPPDQGDYEEELT